MASLSDELLRLSQERERLLNRSAEIESVIEELTHERAAIEYTLSVIERRIEEVKKKLSDEADNVATDDEFTNDFIKASRFADRWQQCVKPIYEYVHITDHELIACDGYKAIMIRNIDIPDKLKNTRIKWDVRDNFENHVCTDVSDYIELIKPIFNNAKNNVKYMARNVSLRNFDVIFQPVNQSSLVWNGYDHVEGNIITLIYDTVKITFNKEFIDLALKCLGEDEFDVYIKSPKDPILFENAKMSIILMPIRMYEGASHE